MKGFIVLFAFLFAVISGFAQKEKTFSYNNFEQEVLAYKPSQTSAITKKSFDFANMVLDEVKSATEMKPENFNVADYLNVLVAFLSLNEKNENLKLAFAKFQQSEGSCEYILHLEKSFETNSSYVPILDQYRRKKAECMGEEVKAEPFDIKEYCTINQLDYDLVHQLQRISEDDSRYRGQSSEEFTAKQKSLDLKNQALIETLFEEHGKYIGRSLVGEKFDYVMWIVIQHSNPQMMKAYLPVVHQAVQDNDLSVVSLKMLIDRYYGLTFGYQVFGTQSGFGFDLANEKQRNEIKAQFDLD